MTAAAPYDARAVANMLLRHARAENVTLTHLALQKLVYFAHGQYLLKTKTPLCGGFFEAWKDGPVHPGIYATFKRWGAEPIGEEAKGIDYGARREVDLPPPDDAIADAIARHLILTAGKLRASVLRNISHAPNGPWQYVVGQTETRNENGTRGVLGPRIPDTVTLARFRHLLVPVPPTDLSGDPGEDTPLT